MCVCVSRSDALSKCIIKQPLTPDPEARQATKTMHPTVRVHSDYIRSTIGVQSDYIRTILNPSILGQSRFLQGEKAYTILLNARILKILIFTILRLYSDCTPNVLRMYSDCTPTVGL